MNLDQYQISLTALMTGFQSRGRSHSHVVLFHRGRSTAWQGGQRLCSPQNLETSCLPSLWPSILRQPPCLCRYDLGKRCWVLNRDSSRNSLTASSRTSAISILNWSLLDKRFSRRFRLKRRAFHERSRRASIGSRKPQLRQRVPFWTGSNALVMISLFKTACKQGSRI